MDMQQSDQINDALVGLLTVSFDHALLLCLLLLVFAFQESLRHFVTENCLHFVEVYFESFVTRCRVVLYCLYI